MKRGRKKLSPAEKRSHYINIAFNENELSSIHQRASISRTKPSIYVRESALDSLDKLPAVIPAINLEKWIELGKVGSNLNQIAHALNSHEQVEIVYIRKVLDNLRATLIRLSLDNNEGLNE